MDRDRKAGDRKRKRGEITVVVKVAEDAPPIDLEAWAAEYVRVMLPLLLDDEGQLSGTDPESEQ